MSKTSNPSGLVTFTTAQEIDIAQRVALDTDRKVILANADVVGIGTAATAAANGGLVSVQLLNQGVHEVILSGNAPTADNLAYAAANGEVTATPNNFVVGRFVTPSQIIRI
jgi:hypothetical protein